MGIDKRVIIVLCLILGEVMFSFLLGATAFIVLGSGFDDFVPVCFAMASPLLVPLVLVYFSVYYGFPSSWSINQVGPATYVWSANAVFLCGTFICATMLYVLYAAIEAIRLRLHQRRGAPTLTNINQS